MSWLAVFHVVTVWALQVALILGCAFRVAGVPGVCAALVWGRIRYYAAPFPAMLSTTRPHPTEWCVPPYTAPDGVSTSSSVVNGIVM